MFYDKELSWLSFNERVLQEAADKTVPIVERIRFLGIYSANLDEFFRVRVANIRRQALLEGAQEDSQDHWRALHKKITTKVSSLTQKFGNISTQCFKQLQQQNINIILKPNAEIPFESLITKQQLSWLAQHFNNRILRHITPIIIHSKTQLASCINDDGIYFLVALLQENTKQYALVEIPHIDTERFIQLPNETQNSMQNVALLDDVVHLFIETLFEGVFDYQCIEAFSFKLIRDSEYNLTDDLDESLLDQMSKGLKQRLKADIVRLVYDQDMPKYMVTYLSKSFKAKELDNLVPGIRYRNFRDFVQFPNLASPHLENLKIDALDAQVFLANTSIFAAISQQDILLYYPYYKFNHFTEFIRQSSYDPLVKQIKINIYRVAKHSRIINALIDAVKNGKKVTVVVELRARFDEQANIEWAKVMKDAGINVEFGIETLKIHSKLCLITRLEQEKIVRYAHIGTGNFHESNARTYTDFSLFTKHKEICQEVDNVFSFISHSYKRFRFNHLIVSPLTSRRRLYQLIDNEVQLAQEKKKARITLKLNNLVDNGLINKLYSASNVGVEVKLLIRGMCSLIPGQKEFSENITVTSIVDLFLEHPRVMIFHNQNQPLVFISSGDWMERNVDHRVEVACPIYDEVLKARIFDIIIMQLADNTKARIINDKQDNQYVQKGINVAVRSQLAIYDYLQAVETPELDNQDTL
jgi:polyphosphate kinase